MNQIRQVLKNNFIVKSSLFSALSGGIIYSIYSTNNQIDELNSNTTLNLNDFECKSEEILYSNLIRKEYTYFDKNTDERVCYIQFEIEPNAGKICWLGVRPKYQRKTLCKQMLNKAKEEVKDKTDKIFGISGSNEIAAWFENNKDDPNIKKTERGKGWPLYEINI